MPHKARAKRGTFPHQKGGGRVQGAQLACWGWLGGMALWSVRKGRLSAGVVRWGMFALLAASMATTITLTVLDHKDLVRTLLPLHLCSLSAFITLYALATGNTACFHFCWYLGLPGAALALLFPAVEPSSWPNLMYTSFMLTHALVTFAPLLWIAQGQHPVSSAAGRVLLLGNAFLVLVYILDKLLHANYMFLLWAPAGTPLAWMERTGRVGYFVWIELGALAGVYGMRMIARWISAPRTRRATLAGEQGARSRS